jgi:hypothetical protein
LRRVADAATIRLVVRLPREPLAPLATMRWLRDAVAQRPDLARDLSLRVVEDLISLMEVDTFTAFVRCSPEAVEEAAEALGLKHWSIWEHSVGIANALAQAIGVPIPDGPSSAAVAWRLLAEDAHDALPHLSPTATRHAVAAFYLIALGIEQVAEQAPQALEISEPWPAPEKKMTAFAGLMQGLMVAGTRGGLPRPVVDAIAHAFWRKMRDAAPEDVVDEAWDLAVAEDALRDDGEAISLDEYRAGQ